MYKIHKDANLHYVVIRRGKTLFYAMQFIWTEAAYFQN